MNFEARVFAMKSYLCIGDIHGCIQQLEELIGTIHDALAPPGEARLPDRIQWIFLGDYIDRGPEPGAVIDYLRQHAVRYPDSIFLRGNHEAMLEDVIEIVGPRRAAQFLDTKNIARENYEWLRTNTRCVYRAGDYLFTHAGLNPERELAEQNDDDYLWSSHEAPFENATGLTVVHGHTSVDEITIAGNNVNVDTGCGKGGPLSAILLPEGRRFRSETHGENHRLLNRMRELEELES